MNTGVIMKNIWLQRNKFPVGTLVGFKATKELFVVESRYFCDVLRADGTIANNAILVIKVKNENGFRHFNPDVLYCVL